VRDVERKTLFTAVNPVIHRVHALHDNLETPMAEASQHSVS
jgi:hypothetical protein